MTFPIPTALSVSLVAAAIQSAGSPVTLPDGTTPPAVKITNERDLQRIQRIVGESPDKVTTVFQFLPGETGVVKGAVLTAPDGVYDVDSVHIERLNGVPVYRAAACYLR